MSPTYWYVTKLFLESEFHYKENKQKKKTQILSKILRFSWREQIQKMKIFKYYTEKDKKYLDKIVIIRTGTYLETQVSSLYDLFVGGTLNPSSATHSFPGIKEIWSKYEIEHSNWGPSIVTLRWHGCVLHII